LVTPDFALRDTILVLAGVVLGGMNRLVSATLGGFAIGFAAGFLGGALPTNQSQYLPSFLFAAVILVLLYRPGGLFQRARQRCVGRRGRARAGRAGRARRRGGPLRHARVGLDADLRRHDARQRRDRRRAVHLHRQLRRRLVRPHQLRRGRGVDGGDPVDADG